MTEQEKLQALARHKELIEEIRDARKHILHTLNTEAVIEKFDQLREAIDDVKTIFVRTTEVIANAMVTNHGLLDQIHQLRTQADARHQELIDRLNSAMYALGMIHGELETLRAAEIARAQKG